MLILHIPQPHTHTKHSIIDRKQKTGTCSLVFHSVGGKLKTIHPQTLGKLQCCLADLGWLTIFPFLPVLYIHYLSVRLKMYRSLRQEEAFFVKCSMIAWIQVLPLITYIENLCMFVCIILYILAQYEGYFFKGENNTSKLISCSQNCFIPRSKQLQKLQY